VNRSDETGERRLEPPTAKAGRSGGRSLLFVGLGAALAAVLSLGLLNAASGSTSSSQQTAGAAQAPAAAAAEVQPAAAAEPDYQVDIMSYKFGDGKQLVVEAGQAGLGQPAPQVFLERAVRGERGVGQGPGHERPHPRPGGHQPLELQLAVRLEHGVRIDRHLPGHLLDRGEPVPHLQQTQPQRVAYLLDQLLIRGRAGPVVQVELNHQFLHLSSSLVL